jgi:hypothetical protein
MVDGATIIRVRLETTQPIELSNFISAFAAIGSEYSRFLKQSHPDLGDDAKIYVSEVRQGSIVADLIPVVLPILQTMDYALVIDQFMRRIKGVIDAYQLPGARPDGYSKSEIKDVMDGLTAIANDPNGRQDIEHITIEGGQSNIRAAIKFDTQQARAAIGNMREHIRMIEHHEDHTKKMVLMRFFQSNIKDTELQKPSGEQVIIQSIDPRPRPLVYASELAKERIKHETIQSETNIFKRGFYVDVLVDMAGDRIAAYKITNFHEVIDLPDEG